MLNYIKDPNTQCWYGTVSTVTVRKRKKKLGRFLYEKYTSKKLTKSVVLRVSCNNPDCVNPEHQVAVSLSHLMYLGRETARGQRQVEKIPIINKIIAARQSGQSIRQIALYTGISKSSVARILSQVFQQNLDEPQ